MTRKANIWVVLALALVFAGTVAAGYFGGVGSSPRVFHIVENTSTAYSNLVRVYGGENVFRFSNFADAMGEVQGGTGDRIVFHEGDYVITSTLTINKGAVIVESFSGNPYDVRLEASTNSVVGFTFTTAADGAQLRNMVLTMDAHTRTVLDGIIVPTTTDGVVISGMTIVGDGLAVDAVGIDSEANRLIVKNCRFELVRLPIQSLGTKVIVNGNYFASTVSGTVALDLQDGDYHQVFDNYFDMVTGVGVAGIKYGTSAKVFQSMIYNNVFNESMMTFPTERFVNGNSSTVTTHGNTFTGQVGATGALFVSD